MKRLNITTGRKYNGMAGEYAISDLVHNQYRHAPMPVSALISNYNDINTTILNKTIYKCALNFIALINNKELYLSMMREMYSVPEEEGIALSELLNKKSSNAERLKQQPYNFIHNGVQHHIEISLYNKDICDINLYPIVAIGTSVDLECLPGGKNIPGWMILAENKTQEILLNEQEADTSQVPVLIFSAVESSQTNEIIHYG